MTGDVRQRSREGTAGGGPESVRPRRCRSGPSMSHDGWNPSAVAPIRRRPRGCRRAGCAGVDHCWWSSKIVERIWRIETSRSSTARMIRSTAAGSVDHPGGRLQRQPGGEQSLDDVVVEIPGDPLAFVEQAGGPGLFVQSGVLDRQAGGGGQADRELLVDVGEHLTVGLVGQVQVAVHDAAQPDRHPEERRHRRVPRREPEAVGMGVQVGQPQRLRFEDQQAEDAVALGTSTDARAVSSSSRPTVMNSASREPDSSSTPSAAYLASTRSAAVCGDATQAHRRGSAPNRSPSPRRAAGATASHRRTRSDWAPAGGYGRGATSVGHDDASRHLERTCPAVIRVFLLDDHEVVRRGVRELLESADDLEVVGEAGTAAEALHGCRPRRPMSPCSTSACPTATGSRCAATSARRCPTCGA